MRPHSKQLLDAFADGKIKLKTSEKAMELIENMTTNYHTILHDRAYIPTKKSLLKVTSQDAMLAQNKLLAKTLETLTTTLSNLPQQLHAVQPPSVIHNGGCNIYGGAHESGSCMVQSTASEVNYMGNQNRQGLHQRGPPDFYQRDSFSQGQGWRSLSHQEKPTKLEELLVQFM